MNVGVRIPALNEGFFMWYMIGVYRRRGVRPPGFLDTNPVINNLCIEYRAEPGGPTIRKYRTVQTNRHASTDNFPHARNPA